MDLLELAKEKPHRKRIAQLRQSLRSEDLPIPSRPLLAQNIIQFLFERRLFDDAMDVYRHMLEDGAIPLPSTDALFLAIVVSSSQAPAADQLEGIQTILAYSTFTEPFFMEFLEHMAVLDIPVETAAELTRIYISLKQDQQPSRSLVMKLIDLQAQAGQIEAAAETIALYDISASSTVVSEPYARAIHSTPVSDQAAVDWIMGVMREKDVPIHIIVFNALIGRQKQLKDLRKAFAIYGVLMRLVHSTPLRPDATTYKHLFRILGHLYKKDYKPNKSRAEQDVGTVPQPRELFADMMAYWFSVVSHPPAADTRSERQEQMTMDASLLLIAFRTFLYLDDYPGALVILQLMLEMGIPVTERVYFVLTRYMARKVYYDVNVARARARAQGEADLTDPVFAFHVMGGEFKYSKMDKADKAYRWIVQRLLKSNARGEGEKSSGRVPTYEEIMGHETTLSGDKLDEWPLVSILHRAIRSSTPTGHIWGDNWRQEVVRKARWMMVPADDEYWSWKRK
ncbi:hypothetical protein FB45DRAFT_1033697 [Roridomyces roridus]|uniref:Uncharacterized protein n=1 Tax=Roridomyces roridus TaxID=1738132 RepID=A0AAD7BEE8_9AGAR|nr:hypothetical protein FB45DRAFT_1033697 [Roridomyces roridus]